MLKGNQRNLKIIAQFHPQGTSPMHVTWVTINRAFSLSIQARYSWKQTCHFRPCIKKDTRERFALKCLMDGPKAHTEVKLHKLCSDHPNIVQVLDVYANDVLFPGDPHPK